MKRFLEGSSKEHPDYLDIASLKDYILSYSCPSRGGLGNIVILKLGIKIDVKDIDWLL
jgi:hypothetical protein